MSSKHLRRLLGAAVALSLTVLETAGAIAQQVDEGEAEITRILQYENSGSKRTAIDEVELRVGGHLTLAAYPEERLYYFLGGRGVMSIYEAAPAGDVYELRQDLAVYLTPGVEHEIVNLGPTPLRFVVFLVTGGIVPDGELSWSAVTQRGVTVENPMLGSGVAVTDVFDEGLNPSQAEGLHLRIHDIWLRRPQKFTNAEVITIAPGRSTRPHTHHDTGETCYILYGTGHFLWDETEIPFEAGSSISYPVGVRRAVVNTSEFPMAYVVMSAEVSEEP
jgi:mannose-6-phosphate isomerase-like protein (cupin superfamily)